MSLSNPQSEASQGSHSNEIDTFLKTMKLHHKDIDACFNDAVAANHLRRLITKQVTAAIGEDESIDFGQRPLPDDLIQRHIRNKLRAEQRAELRASQEEK